MAHYAEYKVKGTDITKDGHTMFIDDVVRGLNRKSILESEKVALTQRIAELEARKEKDSKELDRRRNLLEDVINVLDLSDFMIERHGPLGTEPSVIVTEVMDRKDLIIRGLRAGFVVVDQALTQGEDK